MTKPLLSPSHPSAGRSHHRRVGRHIQAMHPRQGIDASQVFNGGQILVAGTTYPLNPTTARQSGRRVQPRPINRSP